MSDTKDPTDAHTSTCCGGDAPSPTCATRDIKPPSEEELAQQKAFDEEYEKAQTVEEKDGVHKEWYKEAGKARTTDDLVKFIEHLLHDYNHDYGTICHAVTAAAIAAAWVVDRDPRQGGITGFQASCIMWEFISHWGHKEGPMKLMCYDQMLYPQHDEQFASVLSGYTWQFLQERAQKFLDEKTQAHPDVLAHWQSIVAGQVPFGYTVTPEEAASDEEDDE